MSENKRRYLFFFGTLLSTFAPSYCSNNYIIFQLEFIFLILSVAVLGSLLYFLSTKSRHLNVFLTFFVIFILIDATIPYSRYDVELAGAITLIFFMFWKRKGSYFIESLRSSVIAFSLIYSSSLLLSAPPPQLQAVPELEGSGIKEHATGPALPPILHIVLDEQASPYIDSLGNLSPSAPVGFLMGFQGRFTLTEGFILSKSSRTNYSLNALVGLGVESRPQKGMHRSFKFSVDVNRYAELLWRNGYKNYVLQTDYLNFCSKKHTESCTYYSAGNRGDVMSRTGASMNTRVAVMFWEVRQSLLDRDQPASVALFRFLHNLGVYTGLIYRDESRSYTRPKAVLEALSAFQDKQFEGSLNGKAFFIHLMAPHFPYTLDENCNFLDFSRITYPPRYTDLNLLANDVASGYWSQSLCLQKAVNEATRRFRIASGNLDPIIIIHGDHGARLFSTSTGGRSRDDLATFLLIENLSKPMPVTKRAKSLPINVGVDLQQRFHEQVERLLPSTRSRGEDLPS